MVWQWHGTFQFVERRAVEGRFHCLTRGEEEEEGRARRLFVQQNIASRSLVSVSSDIAPRISCVVNCSFAHGQLLLTHSGGRGRVTF